jgi:cyclopropane fatty-acyl-phospholipid synthase-like methyltransferase
MTAGGPPDSSEAEWNRTYLDEWAPWDIGRPQQAFVDLEVAGEIGPPVLDSGCGTGEHALLFASREIEVVGIDISTTAIERARSKAAERGLETTFLVGDVLSLDQLDRRFRTVVDCGVFHLFEDDDRARYVMSLSSVLEDGGVLHLMCFSEHTPGVQGPRRVTQEEILSAFADGWDIERIEPSILEVKEHWAPEPAKTWLARIVRAG